MLHGYILQRLMFMFFFFFFSDNGTANKNTNNAGNSAYEIFDVNFFFFTYLNFSRKTRSRHNYKS